MLSATIERQGFDIIRDVFDKSDITNIVLIIERTPLLRSRAGIRHLMADPAFAAIANDSRLLNPAKEILGESAMPFRATLFDKSPGANWQVTWHQDTALPLQEKKDVDGWGPWSVKEGINYAHAPQQTLEKIIALRLQIDDSTKMNGPLRVIPQSDKHGLLSDEEVSHIACRSSAVDCLAPSGSILFMRPLLIHASSKSKNDVPRRVLHIEYAPSMNLGGGLRLAIA